MWPTHRSIVVALVVAWLSGRAAAAPNLPGGGSPRSDCFVEFDVGAAAFATHGSTTKIECTECDPTCDADPQKDGTCVLRFDVCPKQAGIPSCKPSTSLGPIRIGGATPVGAPVDGSGSACATYQATARTKKRLHGERTGRQTIKVKVSSAGKGKLTDQDTIIYSCVPRADACPTTTTTTTTSTTSTTTTTMPTCASSAAPQCMGPCPQNFFCIPVGNACQCAQPASRRDAKTDIAYVDPREQERLYRELLRFRLARYRYKAEQSSTAPHLGFLIDDVEPSPAVSDGRGDTVDLYGYASMAVAAIQTQAREIAALRHEVATLRRLQRETAAQCGK
jgi:hypothetical protein